MKIIKISLLLLSLGAMIAIHADQKEETKEVPFSDEEIELLESVVGFWKQDKQMATPTNEMLVMLCGYTVLGRPKTYNPGNRTSCEKVLEHLKDYRLGLDELNRQADELYRDEWSKKRVPKK